MRRMMLVLLGATFFTVFSYGTALLIVLHAYRKGYGIESYPVLVLRSAAKSPARASSRLRSPMNRLLRPARGSG